MLQRAALVTGAGSGIGAACARQLDEAGYLVVLVGRDRKKLETVAASLRRSWVLPADVGDAAQVRAAAATLLARTDLEPTLLVNNAGIFRRAEAALGDDELWNEQLNINLLGSVRWVRELWPRWRERRAGSVVNVSSTLGVRPTATTAAYSASKAALINWTLALAQEGGPLGIRANVVCPGLVDTPIHDFHGLPEAEKTATLGQLAGLQPLGRIGTPDEIARAVVFLGTEASAWTTGAILHVDGGINLA